MIISAGEKNAAAEFICLLYSMLPSGGGVVSLQGETHCITASEFIISSYSLFSPSFPPSWHQHFCSRPGFFCPFTHILFYLCSWSARFHFQTHSNVSPLIWLMPSHQTIREAGCSVGLTCLCCSRSALLPTRIMGNSSLSFTRRICLWNL